jgi:hypothetical protein
MRTGTVVALSALMLVGGIGTASAQMIIVEQSPVYGIVPAPAYAPPVVVAPTPRVYIRPAPVYVTPVIPAHPYAREVIVRESVPGWAPGAVYPGW